MVDCSATHDPASGRVCRICFREFPSGYALGGRMRVHGALYVNALLESDHKQQLKSLLASPTTARHGTLPAAKKRRLAGHMCRDDSSQNAYNSPGTISSFTGVSVDLKSFGTNPATVEVGELSSASIEEKCGIVLSSSSQYCDGSGDSTSCNRKLLYDQLRHDPKFSDCLLGQGSDIEEFPFSRTAATVFSPHGTVSCSECGEAFWNERALYGHMRCHAEARTEGLASDVIQYSDKGNGHVEIAEDVETVPDYAARQLPHEVVVQQLQTRGKRSMMKRPARRMASGPPKLLYQSLGHVDPDSASNEIEEDLDMEACLVLLSMAGESTTEMEGPNFSDEEQHADRDSFAFKFKCKSCNKRFPSHQALGGHRASHKKTKGCFLRSNFLEYEEDGSVAPLEHEQLQLSKSAVGQWTHRRHLVAEEHECSICHRTFATGQALGGHKRCHWIGNKPSAEARSAMSTCNVAPSGGIKIDLNLPAASVQEEEVER